MIWLAVIIIFIIGLIIYIKYTKEDEFTKYLTSIMVFILAIFISFAGNFISEVLFIIRGNGEIIEEKIIYNEQIYSLEDSTFVINTSVINDVRYYFYKIKNNETGEYELAKGLGNINYVSSPACFQQTEKKIKTNNFWDINGVVKFTENNIYIPENTIIKKF